MVAVTLVPTRELRNDTAGVLRRVQAGEPVTITVNGRPVAELVPVGSIVRRPISTVELLRRTKGRAADPTFAADLEWISEGTTDDLGPIE